jgi:dephospho-CoA kinase
MIRIGVTGGIASGKSTVCRMFARLGVSVFNADAAVHRLYGTDGVVAWFAHYAPDAVQGGAIHRPTLSRMIREIPALLGEIEAMMHPLGSRRKVLARTNSFWMRNDCFRHSIAL